MNEQKTIPLRERLSSPLTWHYAGTAVLGVIFLVLATRFLMDWAAVSASSTSALAGKQIELKALDIQTTPLRGLDKRVAQTHDQIKEFYADRIPTRYSTFAARVGELQVKSGVRLSRMQYAQSKPDGDLTEISLDAGITGDYPQIMRFVNALERDPTFFVIRAMALTGQQGGLVNLRLRVSTWMRNADAAASGLPQEDTTNKPAASTSGGE
ncbi:MAG TPA: GspMb/PilO family protein [Terracidiphilus sp.]|jgi:Tfp pilus assembly protein PilO